MDARAVKGKMLIAEARVETEHSSRYLVRLCRHVNEAARAHAQMQAHAEWSDDQGVITFGWGTCTLRAEPGVLTVRAEAPDEESLRRLQRRVGNRLERIGTPDRLTVTWVSSRGAGEVVPGQPPRATQEDAHKAGLPRYPDTDDHAGAGPDRGPTTGTQSRVVKAFLIVIAFAALLLLIVMHLLGGGLRGLHG